MELTAYTVAAFLSKEKRPTYLIREKEGFKRF